MARGDIARTYRSAWLTISSSLRWLVLHPRSSELLAIFITVPTGYVERSVNCTDVVRAIDVDEELCECGENVERLTFTWGERADFWWFGAALGYRWSVYA